MGEQRIDIEIEPIEEALHKDLIEGGELILPTPMGDMMPFDITEFLSNAQQVRPGNAKMDPKKYMFARDVKMMIESARKKGKYMHGILIYIPDATVREIW